MFVKKRNGSQEEISFDKVIRRIQNLANDVAIYPFRKLQVNPISIAQYVCQGIYNGVTTQELDILAADQCISHITEHPDYGRLASHIIVSNHHKNTSGNFAEIINRLYNFIDKTGKQHNLISKQLYDVVVANAELIQSHIDYKRDYLFDFFGFKTLEKSYLMHIHGRILERPQDMFMRVALGIHGGDDLDAAFETYDRMSQKYFTHATPTLFNAGTPKPQLSSCYLLGIDDSIDGIFDTVKECALISKWAGGIGLHIHNIRAKSSHIRGTNGRSNGIVPMLKVFNDTARYVDQCFTPDSFIYIERDDSGTVTAIRIADIDPTRHRVLAADGKFHNILDFKIVDAGTGTPRDVVTITTSQGAVTVTNEHPFLVVPVDYDATDRYSAPIPIDFEYRTALSTEFGGESNRNYVEAGMIDPMNYDLVGVRETGELYRIPIISIDFGENYNGRLYDLTIEGDETHNYMTAVGIAHNGGGKRKGSFAIYLEPWHSDIIEFLELKLNTTREELAARDLFYGLWIPDLFMERVKSNGVWSLMSPDMCPRLNDTYGEEFERLYTQYESEGRFLKQIKAQDLWSRILTAQIETGTPYMLYKDACNRKSNQQNIGTIKSSNLCVAPETLVLTESGTFPIIDLVDREVSVWNGDKWSSVIVRKTGVSQSLIRIKFENGSELFCTPYHKFIIFDNTVASGAISMTSIADMKRTNAADLEIGQFVQIFTSHDDFRVPNFIRITEIDLKCDRISDTYCFNESANHAGVFNGILTGNCTEIIEYSDNTETAVCNLASFCVSQFVNIDSTTHKCVFDFADLGKVVEIATRNLNKVIDINYYPTPKTEISNRRHRPIGLGVQGLADTFALMGYAFDSPEAALLNRQIFETIYYHAMKASMELARSRIENPAFHAQMISQTSTKYGDGRAHVFGVHESEIAAYVKEGADSLPTYAGSYSTFIGSPLSRGIFQFDLWGVSDPTTGVPHITMETWNELREAVKCWGVRNSLLVAPMPTASTSQIMGSLSEAFEPFGSNIYTRRTLAGEFPIINRYLVHDLMKIGLWNATMKDDIIINKGSIQNISRIPLEIRERYKTVWELSMKTLIDMSADRGIFVCQSQSLNLFQAKPNFKSLSSMHFYAWSRGLKTGIYYLRTKAAADAQQFTIDASKLTGNSGAGQPQQSQNDEKSDCLMCSA